MASPFKFFRKNQKLWLAGLTIVAMGGFVVLPTVVQMMGDGGNAAAARKAVVTTTAYGDINRITLEGLRRDRQAVLSFMNNVDMLVRTKKQNWRTATVAGNFQRRLSSDEQHIVETWLLVNRAEELGVVVDDAAVTAFLQQITEGVVTNDDLIGTGGEDRGLLGRLELPESQLFRLLKYELTALRLQEIVFAGLMPMTPGERWDYYQRLNRMMRIELAEVPVQRFVAGVADPDEATLKQFFDKYKDQEQAPESPEPGFQEPKRVAVEYFKVDYERLFEPGELEKYYEEHKEEFKRPAAAKPAAPEPDLKGSLPGLEDMPLDVPPAEAAPAATPEAPAPKTEAVKVEESAKPETEAKPAEKPEAEGASSEAPKPDQAKPQEPKQDLPEKKADDAPKPNDESRAAGRPLFQLTAYLAEEAPADQPAEPAEDKPKDDSPAEPKPEPAAEKEKSDTAEAKPAEEKKPDEKPAEPKPVEEKKADEMPAEAKEAEPKAEAAPAKSEPAQPAAPEEKPTPAAAGEKAEPTSVLSEDKDKEKSEPLPEYYTFDEVKSQIQSRLAPDKVEKVFRALENQMTLYHDAQIRYIRTQDDEGKSLVEEPVKPDFAKLAAQAGIEAKTTELFSQREASDLNLDIARSNVTVGDRPTDFLTYVFESLSEFRPARSQDVDGDYYLFWKTRQESQRVPELSEPDVRATVVGAWKMIQARNPAHAEADRLASEARAKQQASKEPIPLATALAGEQGVSVQSTEPFTWFDPTSIQLAMWGYGTPTLSTIEIASSEPKEGEKPAERETVPLLGADFMQAVGGLQPGDIGVAWNRPKTVAYVVRMVETAPDAEELRRSFLSSADPRQLSVIASIERVRAYRQWVESLEASAGLEWQQ